MIRLSAADFKRQFGGAFDNHTTQAKASSSIRLPKVKGPNETEAGYLELLRREFLGCTIMFEAMTLHLPSGTSYTPDFMVITPSGLLFVEVKGSYRLGSAAASAQKFKEAIAAFPQFKFRHAAKSKDASGWSVIESRK